MQLARKDKEELRLLKKEEKEKEKARKKQSQQIKALSFNMLDDEEEEEDDGDDKPEKDADEPAKPEPEIDVKPIPGGSGDFLKKKRLGKIESCICSNPVWKIWIIALLAMVPIMGFALEVLHPIKCFAEV